VAQAHARNAGHAPHLQNWKVLPAQRMERVRDLSRA
jgi:hypothetical protein